MNSPIDPVVLSITVGLVGVVVLIVALVKWHKAAQKAVRALFTWSSFFWIVNLSCMAYSAQNAGYIFGLYENTGVIVGVAIDGLIIAFTQTMLAAKARGEYRRAAQIMLFIVFCCLLSTLGNLAHNLHMNIEHQTSGVWFSQFIPYAVSTMPLFLIALAWVADLKVNPLDKEDPETYRANEEKQLAFRTIQIESSEKREVLQTRAIAVEALRRRNQALRRGKVPGSFRWFWERPLDAGEVITGVSAEFRTILDPQIAQMKHELETLRKEKAEYMAYVERANTERFTQFQQSFQSFIHQTRADIRQDLSEQQEEFRLGLGQQYDQDIVAFTETITNRLETALSDVLTTIREDVSTLKDTYHEALTATQRSIKSDNVIEMTPEIEMVVNRYPIVASWLMRAERSVTLQDIIDGTGHTPHLIHRRAKEGAFRRTRRQGYYRLDSVITWLQTAPLPKRQEEAKETGKEQEISQISETSAHPNTDQIDPISRTHITTNSPDMHVPFDEEALREDETIRVKEGDKLSITLSAMRENPEITDEALMGVLGLKRPGSARFWKVKAQSLLKQSA